MKIGPRDIDDEVVQGEYKGIECLDQCLCRQMYQDMAGNGQGVFGKGTQTNGIGEVDQSVPPGDEGRGSAAGSQLESDGTS